MQNTLNQKIGQATKWSGITEIVAKLITPITNMILARLLEPEAFGVVATLTMVVSFAEIFTDAGFQKYLVQHEFQDEQDLDISTNVAFWTNLFFSLAIWAGIACFATPIAALVGSPGSETAIIVMCFQIPLLAFSSIQMARYKREFDFKSLFVVRISTALVPVAITLPLVLLFRNYWALVIGTLARDVLNAGLLSVKSNWKPRFSYNIKKLKEMLSFSLWTMVENVTIWLTNYVGIFIISSALSEHYLGLYKTTISTVGAYMGIVTSATTPVLFSGLSRCQQNDEAFQNVFFRFQRMVAMLVFPMGVGLFVYRDLATSILLGNQWMETADFLGMWSLMSAITIVFSHYNSEAFRSIGKPKLSILAQVLHLAALIPVLLLTVDKGYEILTLSRSVVRLQMIVVSCILLQMTVKIRFVDICKNIWPAMLSAIVMMLAGFGLRLISNHIVWEISGMLICVAVYAGMMMLLPAGRKQLAEVAILKKILHLRR